MEPTYKLATKVRKPIYQQRVFNPIVVEISLLLVITLVLQLENYEMSQL